MAQETEESRIVRLETKVDAMAPVLDQVAADVTSIRLSLAEQKGSSRTLKQVSHFLVGVAGVLVGHFGHNWFTGGK